MGIKLSDDVVGLIRSGDSIKVLSTKDKNGVVHGVFKDSITVDDDGNIRLLEYLETSQSSRNLTYAIWFHQLVSVTVADRSGRSVQIKGYPIRDIAAGREFEEYYRAVVETSDILDLAGIWIIEPEEIREETLLTRADEERVRYPIVGHMDREVV